MSCLYEVIVPEIISNIFSFLKLLYTGNPSMGTLASTSTEGPDGMQHNTAPHQGLHCLLRFKKPSGTEIHHNFKNILPVTP